MPKNPRFVALLAPALVAVLTAGATLLPAGPAAAAVQVTFTQGVLTVESGNADDAIALACTGGFVKVNAMDPSSGPKLCAKVDWIVVRSGGGDDSILGNGLTSGDFPTLTRISAFGQAGSDWYYGDGDFPETFIGGPGDNRVNYQGGVAGSFTLTNKKLTAPGDIDSISDVNYYSFTLGNGTNSLDASAFGGRILATGGTGNDTLIGTDGDDDLRGGLGTNSLVGGKGDDNFYESGGNDSYSGALGEDEVYADVTANVTATASTFTGMGNDTHTGIDRFVVTQVGATGRTVNFGTFNGYLSWTGGPGSDSATAPAGGSDLTPEAGDDTVNAGAGYDRLGLTDVTFAALSNTTATSSDGNDTLNGALDLVTIAGTNGADTFNASATSRDTFMLGAGGADTMNGGTGSQVFFGATDGDIANGGAGDDSIYFFPPGSIAISDSAITGNLALTHSSIEGMTVIMGDTVATVDGSSFSGDLIVTGGKRTQRVTGGTGDDTLAGGPGKDILRGGPGKDELEGDAGNDRLNGGPNLDVCDGGPGKDRLRSCEKT